jgi:hypothetical protein
MYMIGQPDVTSNEGNLEKGRRPMHAPISGGGQGDVILLNYAHYQLPLAK